MQSKITKGMVLNLSSNADVYARGEKYYRDGKLLEFRHERGENGGAVIRTTVEGNYKNYETTLILDERGQLQKYMCTCESHSIWRGACKHVVAVLLAYIEGGDNIKSASDDKALVHTLTAALEKIIFDDAEYGETIDPSQVKPVTLNPVFHYNSPQEIFLTFTIGRSRMYIIKNVSSFAASVNRRESVSYGSGLSFIHSRDAFDEESRPLLEFVLREDSLFSEISKQISRQYQYIYRNRNDARALTLTERNIDEFFNLYVGKEIDAEIDGVTRVTVTDGMPRLRMRVEHDGKDTHLYSELYELRVINGRLHSYLVSPSSINRVTKGDLQIVLHLMRVLPGMRDNKITFSENEQLRFLSSVLPRLVKMGFIESVTGEPPLHMPSKMTVRYFFDAQGNDVTGWLEFRYDDSITVNPLENDELDTIVRDRAGEYAAKRRILSCGFREIAGKKVYLLTGSEQIYAFLHGAGSGIEGLKNYGEVMVSDSLASKAARTFTPSVGVRLAGNLLELTVGGSGYSLGELLEALESYKARKKFHRLKNGKFIELEDENIASVADMLESLDISKKEVKGNTVSLPAYRALYVDELSKTMNSASTDAPFKNLIESFKNNEKLGFTVPDELENILREYQKTGYKWLSTLAHYGFGGILADDMGLGKTIQVIALMLSAKEANGVVPFTSNERVRSLVVAPTSLLYNWENELHRFAPSLTVQVINGTAAVRGALIKACDADVMITTYDMMKRDTEAYEDKTFEYVIADEAQNIKNPSTQNAKAIKEIKSRVRFALTGTPIENTLTELWSIFDFIMPGYLYSSHKFQRVYETPIVKDGDTEKSADLRRQIAPFVLRRTKRGVLTELPEKTETTLPAELRPEQDRIYQAHMLMARGEVEELAGSLAGSRIKILALLTRLRQICCHPALFLQDYAEGSGKLDLTLETIQMAVESGRRILLFSQFTSMLDILKDALDATPYEYFYLDGASKAADRIDMTERFNKGERDIFLISLKAGGTGLNLTGADVVIHYDPWWNPSVMDQASDRAHRYGQEKAVQIFNIVAKNTIEEKIMALQEKKRNLIESVVTEGGGFINALSEDEIRALFAG